MRIRPSTHFNLRVITLDATNDKWFFFIISLNNIYRIGWFSSKNTHRTPSWKKSGCLQKKTKLLKISGLYR